MVASGVEGGDGAHGEAAEAIGEQPFGFKLFPGGLDIGGGGAGKVNHMGWAEGLGG